LSVNSRPLCNDLTEQAKARHYGHQQKEEKEWPEGFSFDRIDALLKKSIDPGLICIGELVW